MDYDYEYELTKRRVRDLLQNMADDVGSNKMLNERNTERFQSIIYRLMDQV